MPATRHNFPDCNHRGFGEYCHRCEQAEVFEKRAPHENDPFKKAKFLSEAERLRA